LAKNSVWKALLANLIASEDKKEAVLSTEDKEGASDWLFNFAGDAAPKSLAKSKNGFSFEKASKEGHSAEKVNVATSFTDFGALKVENKKHFNGVEATVVTKSADFEASLKDLVAGKNELVIVDIAVFDKLNKVPAPVKVEVKGAEATKEAAKTTTGSAEDKTKKTTI